MSHTPIPMKSDKWVFWAPVRLTEGEEWIDTSCMSSLASDAGVRAAQTNKDCGDSWAKANPVSRFARVKTMEVPEDAAVNAHDALVEENKRLREALQSFLSLCPSAEGLGGHAPIEAFWVIADRARAALKGE